MESPSCHVSSGSIADTTIYKPLCSTSRQIRLLKLHAGGKEEDLACHLETVSLDDNPEYTALSYVWGDPVDTCLIRVHGAPFFITRNLEAALRSIRLILNRSGTPALWMSTLWIDALCVDQKNLAERSHQVLLMKSVYSQAKYTIIWFGSGDRLSKKAIQLMIEMKTNLKPEESPHFNNAVQFAEITPETVALHPMKLLLDRLDAWDALAYILRRPWWKRVWVVQELKFSRNPFLLWGEDILQFIHCTEAVMMTVYFFGSFRYDVGTPEHLMLDKELVSAGAVIQICHSRREEGPRGELLFLLHLFWGNEATDPRDKVYALLGLAVDEHSDSIIPDYEKPTNEVYAELVRDVITREGNLNIFSYCSGPDINERDGIPSWAQDWRTTAYRPSVDEGKYTSLSFLERLSRKGFSTSSRGNVYRAAGESSPSPGFCENMKKLSIVGLCVDIVCELSNPRSDDYYLREVYEGWAKIGRRDDHTSRYLTGQSRMSAFIETLSAGQFTPDSNPQEVLASFAFSTTGRRFFVGRAGYQGLAPPRTQKGDLICVFLGGSYPLILRPVDDHYIMVGDAYGT